MSDFIVIGQDGETGIIFDNMDGWDIIESFGKYEIAFYSKGAKWGLGKYSTKDKAKKILRKIINEYSNYYIYQLPKDSEVE